MPQLDTLTYFSQFFFLLLSFLYIYYFLTTYIIPSTLTADKLRAKFNSNLHSEKALLRTKSAYQPACIEEFVLDSLTLEAFTKLACKSAATATVSDLTAINKISKHNLKSALMLNYTNALANKKRLVGSDLTAI
uniref:ATP synthase F0 subunit 8 n=1 Tax=Gayralia brasiliensis TaxID=1286870 RepID=UPI0024110FE5|nr:ATP synthase F0 subunit 8 [Gayralia brasiliensis]YP_010733833.1 ATP synthase F0 subunit 8 [Monostroma nitidum]WEG93075.1 ATP synthase F0 subunit 8 [Gayralia brasiliensis]WEG93104.1 ATP synthase F0 subunit 8 [Monostroma nitidum]